MSAGNAAQLADDLIGQLAERGIPADRYITETEAAGVNIWAPSAAVTDDDPNLNRYPQASVVVWDSGKWHEFCWGARFEHALPIDTPVDEVAVALIATLPEIVRAAASR